MSEKLLLSAEEAANKAVKFDTSGDYQNAIRFYLQAFDLLVSLIEYSDNPKIRTHYERVAEDYLNRVYELKNKNTRATSTVSVGTDNEQSKLIDNTIIMEKPDVTWNEIAGLTEAKQAVMDAVIIPLKRQDLFKGRETYRAMLLHGPPGCGKTLLAKAAANECNIPFYSLSAADIMDKYVGESEKRIKTLFEKARENQPSIVFIDEFDALTPGESAESNPVQDRIMSEIAAQLDGAKSKKDDRFLFWGATNSPWKLAPRTVRRFSRRIHVPLPDLEARQEIFRLNIHEEPKINVEEDINIYELANLTQGYSGDDIKKICMDTWYIPIHELVDAGTIDHAMPRKVTMTDFINVINKRKPSVSQRVATSYIAWAKEYDTA